MNIFAKIYCRVFQTAFRMALPVLPYREPEIIRSCAEIGKVAKKEKISSVLIVTDKGIVNNGLVDPVEAALQASGVSYCIYADTQPNPTVQNVEDALQVYHVNHCDALIAVGGGSSMDCAKAVGARVAYPKRTVNQLGGKLKVSASSCPRISPLSPRRSLRIVIPTKRPKSANIWRQRNTAPSSSRRSVAS